MAEQEVGIVTHWFGHLSVAGIKITNGPLHVGDTIHIRGHTTDYTMLIQSLQVNHIDVQEAGNGDDIGLKVANHVRQHDKVYKVVA